MYKEEQMGFGENKIRVISIAIIKKGNSILACKAFDDIKNETFYRPLGGGVEFGETPEESLIREFREELGLEIKIIKMLGVHNSIFTYIGKKGHEVVFVYEAEFADKALYNKDRFQMIEPKHKEVIVSWVEVNNENIIYPETIGKFI